MDKTAQSSDSPAVLTCRLPDGTELSRLGMGAMRLPQTAPGFAGPIDEPRATELVDYCMQHGVNYYDTAYIYHGGASAGSPRCPKSSSRRRAWAADRARGTACRESTCPRSWPRWRALSQRRPRRSEPHA